MPSRIRSHDAERRRRLDSLFSPANLERKIAETLPATGLEEGRSLLARLDHMPAQTSTVAQLEGLRLGAKLRALYLSDGDIPALRRATEIAMRDHRDLHQESEYPMPGWPGIEPVASVDRRSGFDRFVAWMAQ